MKKASILACALVFAATFASAQVPSPQPFSAAALAGILGLPGCDAQDGLAGNSLAGAPPERLEKALCTATTNCGGFNVSCTGNSSVTACIAADRNCSAGQRGGVSCDGVVTLCPECPPCYGLTGKALACCECSLDPNCTDCCICNGGSPSQCAHSC